MQPADELLTELGGATDALVDGIGGLTDADARGPSLLPGWTRGHVLTHLARNAEGGARLTRDKPGPLPPLPSIYFT